MKYCILTALSAVLCLFLVSVATSQDVKDRSITSDDFANKRVPAARPAGPKRPGNKSAEKKKAPSYKFVRAKKRVSSPKPPGSFNPSQKGSKTVVSDVSTDIGITMWRLRPPGLGEGGQLFPVLTDEGQRFWLAERVSIEANFGAGDKVRFAIESSTRGHLYVFNREAYADGSFGRAKMIFPERLSDNNRVAPGMLVDFPDQGDRYPYFKIEPRTKDYIGESLTVVISMRQLTFDLDSKGYLKDPGALKTLEDDVDLTIFGREDTADAIYSKREAGGVCGIKTRELTREKNSEHPCAAFTGLTPEDPAPQSIFRVRHPANQPSVAMFLIEAAQ